MRLLVKKQKETPFIMSATSWKNRKNAETIQSDLQGLEIFFTRTAQPTSKV
jgi:hypothetical protein